MHSDTVTDLRFKLLMPHKEGCKALESVSRGVWKSPWWMPQRVKWLAKDGTAKGSNYRWHVLECNSTDCPAIAIVSENDICEAVPHG